MFDISAWLCCQIQGVHKSGFSGRSDSLSCLKYAAKTINIEKNCFTPNKPISLLKYTLHTILNRNRKYWFYVVKCSHFQSGQY